MIRILFLLLVALSAAAFAQTEEKPKAVKVDEFERATNGYVKMKMDYFYVELNNNPSNHRANPFSRSHRQAVDGLDFRR